MKNELDKSTLKFLVKEIANNDDDVARALKAAVDRVTDEEGSVLEELKKYRYQHDIQKLEIETLTKLHIELSSSLDVLMQTLAQHQLFISKVTPILASLVQGPKGPSTTLPSIGPKIDVSKPNKPN